MFGNYRTVPNKELNENHKMLFYYPPLYTLVCARSECSGMAGETNLQDNQEVIWF